jgi:hypothetical protein
VTASMPGGGVSITVSYVHEGLLNLRISLLSNAASGPRDLILQNRDGSSGTLPGGFTITP